MTTQKQYVAFLERDVRGKRLTVVESIRTKEDLGYIGWWGPWRQWVFVPKDGTIWSEDCLAAVRSKILEMGQL